MTKKPQSRRSISKGSRAAARKGDRRIALPRKSASSLKKPQVTLGDRAIKRQFPSLRSRDGCGALVTLAERAGKQWEIIKNGAGINSAIGGGATKYGAKSHESKLLRGAEVFAALGHPQRLRILVKLLGTPGTYQSLMKLTQLGAGPLYHHINQLRMAGLILPKQRDLYELTRGGRNVILTALALEPMMRDKRRRPLAGE